MSQERVIGNISESSLFADYYFINYNINVVYIYIVALLRGEITFLPILTRFTINNITNTCHDIWRSSPSNFRCVQLPQLRETDRICI